MVWNSPYLSLPPVSNTVSLIVQAVLRGDAEYLAAYLSATSFAETRIIYGVIGIKFQPETSISRPPASCFRRSLIIHRRSRGLLSNAVSCSAVTMVYRSSALLRSHGAQAQWLVRTVPSSASRLFGCQ